jgi:hypothetical protein
MLGLLPEARAEAILAEHRSALKAAGFEMQARKPGELTVRPGAHGYWDARAADPDSLANAPLSVAAETVHCPTSGVDVYFTWATLTRASVRLRMYASSRAPAEGAAHFGLPHGRLNEALSELSIADDTGRRYRLSEDRFTGMAMPRWQGGMATGMWDGELTAEPGPQGPVRWLEFSPAGQGRATRVMMPPPSPVPVGTTDPPWPTPAEGYLAALVSPTLMRPPMDLAGDPPASAGLPAAKAGIAAAVADALLAVGALPVTSLLLLRIPETGRRPWPEELIQRWDLRVRDRAVGPGQQAKAGLAVRFPLEHANAVIEGISAQGDLVNIWLYGHPWPLGEYWPMITPCFEVRAIDDCGAEHHGQLGEGSFGGRTREGTARIWFWPPVAPQVKRIRVIVNTLWEAAWADIALPGR